MKIKRYTGSNAQEAMLKVKMDMGNDAIILHTRNIKQKGWFRFFSKPMVEILAAIDDEYGNRRPLDTSKVANKLQKPSVLPRNQGADEEETDYQKQLPGQMSDIESKVNRLEAMIRRMYEHTQGSAGSGANKQSAAKLQNVSRPVEAARTAEPVQRIAEVVQRPAAAVQKTAENMQRPSETAQTAAETALRTAATSVAPDKSSKTEEPRVLEPLIKNMENQEIDKEIINQIAIKAKENFLKLIQGSKQQDSKLQAVNQRSMLQTEVVKFLKQELEEIIGEPKPIKLKEDGRPTVAIFLGPTGVGKTTTIAKIAANYALNKNRKVALITSDTYRIAAVDQLKTYAEILSLPVSVVYSADEMGPAIEENVSADLILIDTAGISHKRKQQMDELKSVIDKCQADEVYLVMSATASWKNCCDVIRNHQFLNDYKMIFTKLDEAPSMGLILNARYHSGKSLSYVTTGQSVPDDIDLVNVEKLTKNLLRSTAQ